jgi:HEAT repeat protein
MHPSDARRLLDLLRDPSTDADAAQSALLALRDVPLSPPETDPWRAVADDLAAALPAWARDANPDIRYQALVVAEARALSSAAYVGHLPSLLGDPDAEVRMLASQALSRLGDRSMVPTLQAAFARARLPEERLHLLDALRALGVPNLCAAYLDCLNHSATRFAALRALGELGDAAAAPTLKKLARRWWSDPFERVAAAASLCLLKSPDGPTLLGGFVHSRRSEVRGHALQAAARVRLPDALPWLLAALQSATDPAAAVVPPLLAGFTDPSAQAALHSALSHPNPEVREAAQEAARASSD